jgi:hypothetical protein
VSCSRIALCLIARSARGDVRAAVFVGADGTEKRCSVILLLQTGGANIEDPPLWSTLAARGPLRVS